MRIACVSDTHGKLKLSDFTEADLLIVAGDYCPNFHGVDEAQLQLQWIQERWLPLLKEAPYTHKIVIAGNHDWVHEKLPAFKEYEQSGITYLQDSGVKVDGLNIYGTPWQPWFYDWAFNFPPDDDGSIAQKVWELIPNDTDILITHGPPYRVLDRCADGRLVGCPYLANRVKTIKPKLHVFGHIHESYGSVKIDDTIYVNAALCNLAYKPVNKVQIVQVS